MGAPRDIATYRLIGHPNQNGDGKPGLTYGWVIDWGTYRTRLATNGDGSHGTYCLDGETWYFILASRVLGTGHSPARTYNWHDTPAPGYSWGFVSPLAKDIYLPAGGGHNPETSNDAEYYLEYTSNVGDGIKPYNAPGVVTDHYIFDFVKVKFKTDGTGTLDVWQQNLDSPNLAAGPIISATGKRTLDDRNGTFPGCQLWHGMYISSGFTSGANIQIDHMLCMAGQSWQQAWDDVPVFVTFQTNNPNPATAATCTALGVINTSSFPIPNAIAAQLTDPPGGGGGGSGGNVPTYVGAGTENTLASGTSLTPRYPSGIVAGDLLVLQTIARSTTTAVPSGWASVYSDTQGLVHQEVLTKTAAGTETGNLTVNFSGSDVHTAIIYAIRGGTTLEAAGVAKALSGTAAPASLTTGGNGRLVVAVVALQSGQNVTTAFTGQTGGTWALRSNTNTNDSTQLQTANMASTGTISGGSETVGSAGWIVRTFAVVGSGTPPVNQTAPVVSGTPTVGQVLSVTNGTWLPSTAPVYTYKWRRDSFGNGVFVDIGSATSQTYTLVTADDGCNILCQVTDTDTGASTATSNVVGTVIQPAAVNAVVPAVTGTATLGNVLSTTNGTWTNMGGYLPTFTYQWMRDNAGVIPYAPISGAAASTYTLAADDNACHVLCVVTAHNTNSLPVSANSNAILDLTPRQDTPLPPPSTGAAGLFPVPI